MTVKLKKRGIFAVMTDLIRLLPESVANQIAAGEVVQRPASAVKELLENTIDAGATDIKLIIKESGKALIQIIDNGCGMSERDARMCFERHATSKIQSAEDLTSIRTLGFRGEALASIASVAQVEVRTRRLEDEIGTCVRVEGTELKEQSPVNCLHGTSISVKNLFFNVPARRNFLKSNTLELKYIIEEFFRVALVNPGIAFQFYNHDKILFQLSASSLKQRIINLFGTSFSRRLIPVEQQSALINIGGFIGKPEFAKKTRGEQYFFTNGRFMKNYSLHHAVESAFRELIPKDFFPTYFIYMEVDPKTIDVNIHPTKTEINFLDVKSIYAILHAAIKQAIGKFNLSPSLDFEVEQSFDIPPPSPDRDIKQPTITINPDYNPFEKQIRPQTQIPFQSDSFENRSSWKKFYEPINQPELDSKPEKNETLNLTLEENSHIFQVQNTYIVTHSKRGVLIIDQQNAHERVLYEKLMEKRSDHPSGSQTQLIPHTINLTPEDTELLKEWRSYFEELGFDITNLSKNSFIIYSIPAGIANQNLTGLFEEVLEQIKSPGNQYKQDRKQNLTKIVSKRMGIKRGQKMHPEEMNSLVAQLFACKIPDISPDGKPIFISLSYEELLRKFKTNLE